jgi:hypothetical protein
MDPIPRASQDAVTVRLLRFCVGLVAMALPFVLIAGNAVLLRKLTLLGSMSGSYYTGMRDVFVGSMCAIGVFLICYRYEQPDDILSTVAGSLAILVALCHTTPDDPTIHVSATGTLVGRVHLFAAAALFLLLGVFCVYLFTRTHPDAEPTRRKRARNRVYRVCGLFIFAAVAAAAASNAIPLATRQAVRPLYWCETVAVLAFGIAWFVKSGTLILKDADRVP